MSQSNEELEAAAAGACCDQDDCPVCPVARAALTELMARLRRAEEDVRAVRSAAIKSASEIVLLPDVRTRASAREAIDRDRAVSAVMRMRRAMDEAAKESRAALNEKESGR